jgi:hypothetical protein
MRQQQERQVMSHDTLTFITILGLALSFLAGVTSQIWKDTVEVEGQIKKRLTPAGWLSLGISLVGLSGSVASELIRVSISHSEELQSKAERAQKQALEEQEARWRNDTSTMLSAAKADIEKNLEDTIKGFQDSQTRFSQTQAEIISSRQSLLENALLHTNEIIVAGQPLTSLSLHWKFTSTNTALSEAMTKGAQLIAKNSEEEQGGSPEVPYNIMEYEAALIPLLSHVARIGNARKAGDAPESDRPTDGILKTSIAVVMPLDESQNAVISFGEIGKETSWYENRDGTLISAGFIMSADKGRRKGNSTPTVIAEDSGGTPSYAVDWKLDPATLAYAIDKRNAAIATTGKLPAILKVAIFYDARVLPFQQNNFGVPQGRIWDDNDRDRRYIAPGHDFENAELTIEVNGFQKLTYSFQKMYKVHPLDEYDDEIDTGCTILEFRVM